jgi:hypothetical protein
MSGATPVLSSAPKKLERFRNAAFYDQPYRQIGNSSYESCYSSCESDNGCEVFTFFRPRNICKLIAQPSEYFRNADVNADSGIKRQLPPVTSVAAGIAGQFASAPIWAHNGSLMELEADGAARAFRYFEPREGLQRVGIETGTVLFTGQKHDNSYSGTAYTFTSRCGKFPFRVSGPVSSDSLTVKMSGQKPRIDPRSCSVLGHDEETLVFEFQRKALR